MYDEPDEPDVCSVCGAIEGTEVYAEWHTGNECYRYRFPETIR